MESANTIASIEDDLSLVYGAADNAQLKEVWGAVMAARGLNMTRFRLHVCGKFDDVREAVQHLNLPNTRIDSMVGSVLLAQEKFLIASQTSSVAEFKAQMPVTHLDMLRVIGDALELGGVEYDLEIDRSTLSDATDSLISDVASSNLDGYRKKVLQLKLQAISRMLCDASGCSDGEIRTRVKSVFADYCAEFRGFDRNFESINEKMLRWAGMVSRPGLLALAITSDVTQVAGLLPPPL